MGKQNSNQNDSQINILPIPIEDGEEEDVSTIQKTENYDSLNTIEDITYLSSQSQKQNSDQPKTIVSKQKTISKPKLKQKVFGFQVILRTATDDFQKEQQRYEQLALYQIPCCKVFFVAGDILVELKGPNQEITTEVFNEFRHILDVEKTNNAISFHLESVRPLKQLSEVIYLLENSQDQQQYEFAQGLKNYQMVIFQIQDQVLQTTQFYEQNSIDFLRILQEREEYVGKLRQKIISELVSSDEFSCVGTLSISYGNQTSTVARLSITKPTVALLGTESEDLAQFFMRKGFTKLFNSRSRRFIFSSNMQFQLRREDSFEISIPQFEIMTMDDIQIVCECRIKSLPIKFPPHLIFQGENANILNSIESLFYVRYMITPQHLETLLKIRGQYTFKSPQNLIFPQNYCYNSLEVEDFEYSMQCMIFLEKYYDNMVDKIESEKLQNEKKQKQILDQIMFEASQPCGYRYI